MPRKMYKKKGAKSTKSAPATAVYKPRSRGKNNLIDSWGGSVGTVIAEPWQPIFPSSITRRLRYSTSFAVTATSGAIGTIQVFRANDLFDPDFTGTGHQPMGFDQMMVWYNHFTVLRSKITCVVKNTGVGSPTACLRVDGDSTTITVIDRVVEVGGCVTESLEGKNVYGANKSLSISADMMKLQNVSRSAITSDPSLQGSAGASPVECTYYHCMLWDPQAVTANAEWEVVIDYEAVFSEPRVLTQS